MTVYTTGMNEGETDESALDEWLLKKQSSDFKPFFTQNNLRLSDIKEMDYETFKFK